MLWKISWWVIAILAIVFVGYLIYRGFSYTKEPIG